MIHEIHAKVEIARPSATSRASYSNRNVQRPGAGTFTGCQPPVSRALVIVGRMSAPPESDRSGPRQWARHCGSASWETITHDGSSTVTEIDHSSGRGDSVTSSLAPRK